MASQKYRLVTRSDFDGLVCAALLQELGILDGILFVHPKDVQDGQIELTGKSPLSPNGGHLGEGYIHGLNLLTEGVRQARGTAANQVANVESVFLASGVAGAIIGAV